jgi:tetratricopeptide (TPR) repeat protein
LPLFEKIKEFCELTDLENREEFFLNEEFFQDDFIIKGLIYFRIGEYLEARCNLYDAIENLDTIDDWKVYYLLGGVFYKNNEFIDSIELFQSVSKKIPEERNYNLDSVIANSYNNIGLGYKSQGCYEMSIAYYKKSVEMGKQNHRGINHRDIATSLDNLGFAYISKGEFVEAKDTFEESLKVNQSIHGNTHHSDIATSHDNIGVAYYKNKNFDEAMQKFEESQKLNNKIYKDTPHLDKVRNIENIGDVFYSKCKYEKAIKSYEESLAMEKLIYKGAPHLNIALSLQKIGKAYISLDNFAFALKLLEEGEEIVKQIQNNDHLLVNYLIETSISFAREKNIVIAEKKFKEALGLQKKILNNVYHKEIITSLDRIGDCYLSIRKYDLAMEKLKESHKLKVSLYKSNCHEEIAKSLEKIADCYTSSDVKKSRLDTFWDFFLNLYNRWDKPKKEAA